MKYQANPVIVDAFTITGIRQLSTVDPGSLVLFLEGDNTVHATPEMTARFTPSIGDYFVIQSDGYGYLNPKAVFERKYSPCNRYLAQTPPDRVAWGGWVPLDNGVIDY